MIPLIKKSFETLVKTNLVNTTETELGKQSILQIKKELDTLNSIIKENTTRNKAIPTGTVLEEIRTCLEKIIQKFENIRQIMILAAVRHTDRQKSTNILEH